MHAKLVAIAFAATFTIGVAAPSLARAAGAGDPTDSEKTLAKTLFDEGVKLMTAGDTAAACSKFEDSLHHFAGIGTRGKLAECYEHLGRVASSWALWREVEALSKSTGDKARVQAADKHVKTLAPRLPYVTYELPADAADAEVQRDGKVVAPETLGTLTPIDPGTHTFSATAKDGRTFKVDLDIAEGQKLRVKINLKAVAPEPMAKPEPPKPPVVKPEPVATDDPPKHLVTPTPGGEEGDPSHSMPTTDKGHGRRVAGWVLVGIGSAGMGAAGVLSISALSAKHLGENETALKRANLATAFVIGGGVVAVVGLVLIVTAPKLAVDGVVLAPSITPDGASLVFAGTF